MAATAEEWVAATGDLEDVRHAPTPYQTITGLAVRPIAGVVVHDTETDVLAYPHPGGSWHVEVDRAGALHRFVADQDVAWSVRACDRWHPGWLPKVRPWSASAANCWTLGVELVSSQKWRNQGKPYTLAQYASLRTLLAEWRRRYGPLPVVGHGLLQADRTDPVRFDWSQLHDPLSLWPLAGTARVDQTQGGWGFMDWTGDEWHPGVDLNAGGFCAADAGAGIVAPVGFTCRYRGRHVTSTGRGFGWHLWGETNDDFWLHFCHLQEAPSCLVWEHVERGRVFGLCGKTLGWDCEHLHFEVTHKRPASWDQWPRGWTRAQVEAVYVDPFAYLAATSAARPVQEEPMPILNDAQLISIQAGAWGEHWQQTDPDFAIPKAWRAEVQAGRHPGRPTTGEQDIPGTDGGKVMWFSTGRFAVYVPGHAVSWNA
jgi:N-acetylmuramoyl-L-alanine amidase